MPSPLTKYQRQPKQYIDLPSKGQWYPQGALEKHEELAVYSMTASDEIATKTPDALLSGVSTANIIKNCIPSIIDPWAIPIVDIYTILSAIRMASYTDAISINDVCKKCGEENTYEIGLQGIIGHFGNQTFETNLSVADMKFELRPLSYKEFNSVNKDTFKLQRRMVQDIPEIENDDLKGEESQKVYDKLSELKANTVISSIAKVITDDGEEETDIHAIAEFIKNSDKEYFSNIEELLIKNNNAFAIPNTDTTCATCSHNDKLEVEMDYSNFFVQG
tara:strand:- start:2073 stop:2900 length:828 start_codon:yes stop_codon:yes gene_type:complete